MPYTENILSEINTLIGTFKVTLYADDALGILSLPSKNTILEIGELTELVERNTGELQLDSLGLKIADTFENYGEGFWYKVLNTDAKPRLKIILNEGNGDTLYYFGEVDLLSVKWEEQFINEVETEFIRTVEFDLISLLKALDDVTTAKWLTEAETNATTITPTLGTSKIISLMDMIASLLAVTFPDNNTTFDSNDVSFIYDGSNPALKFLVGGSEKIFSQLWVCLNTDIGGGGTHVPYWDNGSNLYLGRLYTAAKDLLKTICKEFGLFTELTYNIGTNRFHLNLLQRSNAYATTITMKTPPKESVISRDFEVKANAVLFSSKLNGDQYFFETVDFGRGGTYPSVGGVYWGIAVTIPGAVTTIAIPPNAKFDVNEYCLWVINENSQGEKLFFYDGTLALIDNVKFKNSSSGVYESPTSTHKMQEAICRYEFIRYSKRKKVYDRVYGSLQADDGGGFAHTNVSLLRQTSIDDGTGSTNFFINKFVKRPEANEVEIQWVQE